ncbi:MAG: type II toxin-antitoxin system ParD family antitoxin [Mesorhizobium sp.]|uniref:ribbon-helix-helix domain-containing protein n=1 Tax=Mesorhizobium sp. TaxID=1871066 RepID=UPI00121F8C40|nr:type II toxin-antitoxin system ParD family antitoxin [Mesorhizobium sp.]TIR27494.1 MAG: type II toxin-antitoxin system ParD family antitoxin [Mesorhizobium sp.]
MGTIKISLPTSLKHFVDQQVTERGFGTSSEYVRELIRHDQDRHHLRSLLLKGASSMPTVPIDDDYFAALCRRARGR